MISDLSTIQRLQANFPFIRLAEAGFLERLLQAAAFISLDAGQPICHEGDRCGVLPLILEGSARVYKGSTTGREITLYRLGPGESCVLTASCILSASPFPASALSETAVSAVVLPSDQVITWLGHSPAWRGFLFGLVADRLQRIISVVEDVVFLRMDQRLADYLMSRPSDPADGWIHLTHQQIADDLGTSREVITRLLKDFEQKDFVEAARGRLKLTNRNGIRRITDTR